MSRNYDAPDRTWSSDSHLLPAGIRHVPRRDIAAQVRSEEPPPRPWEQGEPARQRPARHVRFQESYDDYPEYERAPPRRPPQYYRESAFDAEVARQAERLELERVKRALELEELRKQRAFEERALAEKRRRRRESDEEEGYYLDTGRVWIRDRRQSPSPPVLKGIRKRRAASADEDAKQARRSRSASPTDRFIKAELYSDPESYDVEPETATSSGYEPQPASVGRTRSPPASGSEDEDSDDAWDSGSDVSGESYDFYHERKIYEFNPSHISRNPSQDASTTLSGSIGDVSTAVGSGSGDKGPRGPSPDPSIGSKILPPCRIYQSEYTGDGFPEGSHSVRLTAILGSRRQRQPLFRWRHVHQTIMNFDELSKEVGRIGGLSDSENHGLQRLLTDVKKYSIKSTPTSKGSNVKHMEPGLLQVRLEADSTTKTKNTPARTATWLCIPYFSLQKYAGPLSGATSGSFPTRTLLQEQYSGVSAERDMQQAVCQTEHVPPGMCFHVAQMWCIVLDDSLLVTCGTMADPTKKGDFEDMVELVIKPSQDSTSSITSFIYVYYTEAVTYALPVEKCKTWFAFISHFHDFWPQTLKFTDRDRVVTAEDWPRIFNTARLSTSKVVLVLKLGALPQPPPRGVIVKEDYEADNDRRVGDETTVKADSNLKLPDKGKQNATRSSPAPSEPQDEGFHVFSWLETPTAAGEPGSHEHAESVRMQLQEIDDFLRQGVSRPDRNAYKVCPEATRMDVLAYLEKQSTFLKKSAYLKREIEDRVDIFNAADIVFHFFLPLGAAGPTVGKFWGAVRRVIQMPKPEATQESRSNSRISRPSIYDGNAGTLRNILREYTQEIQAFSNIVSHAELLERTDVTIPIQLVRAWIYMLLALAKATSKAVVRNPHYEIARMLLKEGMAELMQSLPSEDLLAREVVMPTEVVCLLSLKLLQDTTGPYPNLDTIYSEYLNALDNEVATKPSDRSFEHRLNLLKQEATVINRIANKQRRIFAALAPADSRSRELQTINLLTTPAGGPAPKKRALDEGGDYYQSQTMQQPQRAHSVGIGQMEKEYYVEREQQFKVSSTEQQRAYSRAPTVVHETYAPQNYYRSNDAGLQLDNEVGPAKEYYRLSPTRPGGFRDLLTTDCLSLIDRRSAAFTELFPYANYLQEYNKNKYDTTRDRQEQAIYAFTIVTVIFLPLSAVAGIFGMNTADVRDMAFDQWLYWATAVPVTIAVVIVGLWWMGELGNAVGWVMGLGRRTEGYLKIGGAGGYGRGMKMGAGKRVKEEVVVMGDDGVLDEEDGGVVMRQDNRLGAGAYVDNGYRLETTRQRPYQRPWAN